MKIKPLGLLLALLSAGTAQATGLEDIGPFIERSKAQFHLPYGTALAVVKDDKIVYEHYSGYANITKQVPVDHNTVFYTASVTKPLFALNVLMSEHKGELDTQTPLADLYPDIQFKHLNAKKIHSAHLLAHTSGINPEPMVWPLAYSGQHDLPLRQRLLSELTPSPDSVLGEFDYANIGYTVLSVWYDQQAHSSWQESLAQQVYAPLGMQQTSSYMSDIGKQQWTFAQPYSTTSATPQAALYLRKQDNTMHAAGGTITTAKDLAKVVLAHLNKGRIGEKQALPAKVVAKSQQALYPVPNPNNRQRTFSRDQYGWGWYVGQFDGQRIYHHGGGFAGASAHVSFLPEVGVGLVLLNNEGRLGDALNNLFAPAIYRVLMEDGAALATAEKDVASLKGRVEGFMARIKDQRESRLKQTFALSQPLASYTGTYVHPLGGSIVVSAQYKALHVSWGNLRSLAEPYDKEEQIRLELVPEQGKVMAFNLKNDRVASLRYAGMEFSKQ